MKISASSKLIIAILFALASLTLMVGWYVTSQKAPEGLCPDAALLSGQPSECE